VCAEVAYVCCSVLPCVVVCCNVFQCGEVCCSMLQWIALRVQRQCRVCCSELQCVAMSCSALHCVGNGSVHCVAVWRVAACCSVLRGVMGGLWRCLLRVIEVLKRACCMQCVAVCCQCVAVCCRMLPYVAVCCSVLQCVAMCHRVL